MKAVLLFFILSLSCLSAFAQEDVDLSFENSTNPENSELSLFKPATVQNKSAFYEFGQFNIPQIEGFSFVSNEKMDMLSLGKQMGLGSQSSFKFPESQNLTPDLQQNRFNKHNFRVQTNAYLNSDNKKTPDGGIRNDVYEGAEQPFIRPYRGYNPYHNRNYNTRGRTGIYFSRR